MTMHDERGRLPSRRAFLSVGLGAFVVAAVPVARARQRTLVRRTLPVMGTVAEIGVVHRDARHAHGALDAAFAELTAVENAMSRFLPDSDVGRANAGAALAPVTVSAATGLVLAEALRWAHATDGAFDPCLGGAVALWDVGRRHAPPAAADVQRFAGRQLHRSLEVHRSGAGAVVAFDDADVALDLGGIAKGYGVDRAVDALRAWGIRDAIVNVGGDLYAAGVSEDGDPWEVGVRSASDPAGIAGAVRISDRAIATSGDYFQFFDHGGRRYHHLIDPVSGEPRLTAVHSLSVEAADCMSADAAATALYGTTTADATRMLARVAPHARLLHLG